MPIITVTSRPPFRDIHGRFIHAEKAMLEEKRDQMRKLAKDWVEAAKKEAPRGKGQRSGRFVQSISTKTFISKNEVSFRAYDAMPLGGWIREGTKPHIIRAKNARRLYFYWPRGFRGPGWYAFVRVHHPGTKPNPYHIRATKVWRMKAVAALQKISRKYTVTLTGSK